MRYHPCRHCSSGLTGVYFVRVVRALLFALCALCFVFCALSFVLCVLLCAFMSFGRFFVLCVLCVLCVLLRVRVHACGCVDVCVREGFVCVGFVCVLCMCTLYV